MASADASDRGALSKNLAGEALGDDSQEADHECPIIVVDVFCRVTTLDIASVAIVSIGKGSGGGNHGNCESGRNKEGELREHFEEVL